jgi:outer membrane receptor protein involved in Fe transport
MKFKMVALLAAMAMLGGTSGLALAADDGVYRLGEVVVSGENRGVEAIGTTHKVTAEDIETRGARTLDETIDMLPGVSVRVGGDGAPRIDIRGYRTRNIKLLLNGTPFNGTYDGQFDPSMISVENIAEVSVTTGGGSELYGAGGNAGVINIVTKTGTKGGHGSLGVERAEVDATLLRATGSYGAKKYSLFVSGSSYERDAYRMSNHFSVQDTKYEDGDERENSDRERKNFFVNLGYQPTDATLLGLTFSYLTGERGKPQAVVKDAYLKKVKFEREDDAEEINIQVAVSHDFSGPLSIKGWAYYNKLDLEDTAYTDKTYKVVDSWLDSETEISGANLQLAYDMRDAGRATLGLMMEDDDYSSVDDGDAKVDEDFQLYSVSMEYEVAPLDKLGVVLGAGAHWQNRDEQNEEDFTYLVGMTYDLLEGTRLKASHSRKVRFPSLKELYDGKDSNPELGAETTWNYELGVEQQLPAKTLLSVTGFYSEAEDFIEKVGSTRENFDEYEFYGAEVTAENRYFDRLLLVASYSYLSSEDKSDDATRDELQNRPEHKVTLEGTYMLPWNLTAYGSAQYITDNYYYDDATNSIQEKLSDVFVVDFKLNKAAANGAIDLYVGIDNVFDEDYQQSYGYTQPGRTFYGGVTWKY